MNITRCQNNHYFDIDKFVSCPHCANQMAETTVEDIFGKSQKNVDTAIPNIDSQKNYQKSTRNKTVGWLVCIGGAMLGESFILREGDNFIGRAGNMDVALVYETSVSRSKHAVITYEANKNACILHSPKNSGQTFCNNKVVKVRRKLKNQDVITLGNCVLLFVALCSSSFMWENIPRREDAQTPL